MDIKEILTAMETACKNLKHLQAVNEDLAQKLHDSERPLDKKALTEYYALSMPHMSKIINGLIRDAKVPHVVLGTAKLKRFYVSDVNNFLKKYYGVNYGNKNNE